MGCSSALSDKLLQATNIRNKVLWISVCLISALAHVSRQMSFENTSVSYHLWQNIENLYASPVNGERLQNIATCLRDDMDQKYGYFWQVVMNRNERFGLASTHQKGFRHAVGQKGVYVDRRVFCFNHLIFRTLKPSVKGAQGRIVRALDLFTMKK